MWSRTIHSILTATTAKLPVKALDQVKAGARVGGDRYFQKQGTFFKPAPDFELTLIEVEAIEALERNCAMKTRPGRGAAESRDSRGRTQPSGGTRVPYRRGEDPGHPAMRALPPPGGAQRTAGDQRASSPWRLACADPDRRGNPGRRSRGGVIFRKGRPGAGVHSIRLAEGNISDHSR